MTAPIIDLDRFIEITPGVCGGKPRIAGHRITVQNVAIWHERMGMSADEIASDYNREQLEADLKADEAFVAEMKKRFPSKWLAK